MTAKSGQLVFLSNVALTPRLRLRRFYESLGDARAMRGYPCRGLHCIAYYRSLFVWSRLRSFRPWTGRPASLRSHIAFAMPNKGSRVSLGIPGRCPPLTISPLGRTCLPTTPLAVGGHVSGSPHASCLGHDGAADACPGPRFAAPPKAKAVSHLWMSMANTGEGFYGCILASKRLGKICQKCQFKKKCHLGI